MPSGVEWAFRFASEVSRNPAAAVSRWKSLSGRQGAGGLPPTCDTFQNAFEVLFPYDERPRFPFVFPASADAPGASEYLLDRVEAFREWAGRVSGREGSGGAREKTRRVRAG